MELTRIIAIAVLAHDRVALCLGEQDINRLLRIVGRSSGEALSDYYSFYRPSIVFDVLRTIRQNVSL